MKPVYHGKKYKKAANQTIVQAVESGAWHACDYQATLELYDALERPETNKDLEEQRSATWAYLGAVDRYFLLTMIFGRVDAFHPWLFDRCREVELDPDDHLDLWARDHYKSTIITYSGAIQEIINDPEITIGIFSHTKPISRAFIKQIKREMEQNEELKQLYPDIFWTKPSEAPLWTDNAIIVKRAANPKEATIEAHGLVGGQPTSKHFKLLIYDDVVTRESVTTPDQIRKTTEAWELSDNLGSKDDRRCYIGTRYHFGDTYGEMLNRNVVTPRLYPATHNGQEDGAPVFLSQEKWDQKKRTQRSTLAAQMLQNPIAGKERMFKPEWLRSYEIRPGMLNIYIMGDPSKGSNNRSDNTAIAVIGIDANSNKYLLDGFCHRMNMADRWKHLSMLHRKWTRAPGVNSVNVGWERYGQQTDDEYFQEKMQIEKHYFAIEELAWPRDNTYSKADRVERLQPDMQYSRFFMPHLIYVKGSGDCRWSYDDEMQVMRYTPSKGPSNTALLAIERGQEFLVAKSIRRIDEEGEIYDVTRKLIDEALFFPFAPHDDMVDVTSRIYDMTPLAAKKEELPVTQPHEDA